MYRMAKWTFVLALLLMIASSATAAGKKKKKNKANRAPQAISRLAKSLAKADLTDEQQQKIEGVNAEYTPKLREAQKNVAAVLGPELRKKRNQAMAAARKAGKKGKEVLAAADAAIALSTEQKESLASAQAANREVQQAYRKAVVAVLEPAQRKAAGLHGKGKGKRKGKGKKKKAA